MKIRWPRASGALIHPAPSARGQTAGYALSSSLGPTIVIALALVVGLLTPTQIRAMPRAVSSEYLTTEAATFVVRRQQGVVYVASLRITGDFNTPLFGRVTYQDATAPSAVLTQEFQVKPGQQVVELESPVLSRVRVGEGYEFEVRLFSDAEMTQQIGLHVQPMRFEMPAEFLRNFGIEIVR